MDFEQWYNKQKNNTIMNPIDTFNMAKHYMEKANGDMFKAVGAYGADYEKIVNNNKNLRNFEKTMTPIVEDVTGIDMPNNKTTENFETPLPTITDKGIVGGMLPKEFKEEYNKIANEHNNAEDIRQKETNSENAFNDAYQKALEQQKRLWEREDAIRKETQEREDTAYQRAVEDMRKAGINPNLVGINPSSSGGGITQATKMDNTSTNEELNLLTQEIIKNISNEFELKENEKDRFSDLLGGALNLLLMKALFKK